MDFLNVIRQVQPPLPTNIEGDIRTYIHENEKLDCYVLCLMYRKNLNCNDKRHISSVGDVSI